MVDPATSGRDLVWFTSGVHLQPTHRFQLNAATSMIPSAIWKFVPLLVTATFFLVAAGAAGHVFARQNPQWSRATKLAVYVASVTAAALAWALFFLVRWRSGA